MARVQRAGMNGDIFGVTGGQKAYRERRQGHHHRTGFDVAKIAGRCTQYPGRTNQLQPLIAYVKYGNGIEVIHMLGNHAARSRKFMHSSGKPSLASSLDPSRRCLRHGRSAF
ncbi:hypothetical protein LJR255_002854 [Pararhizobium sp. LjRoot255]|uniref:hypothetical protein n=1 Tax=Pararhizobium sp. LjRoot255 TaxID=3342298 RepID=UPI003ED09D78